MKYLLRKTSVGILGVLASISLNLLMLLNSLRGIKNLVLMVNSSTQIGHLEALLLELGDTDDIQIVLLSVDADLTACRRILDSYEISIVVGSLKAARFLLFHHAVITVEQGNAMPLLGRKTRICSFHGQPSKGDMFPRFNFSQIDMVFLYGEYMRQEYDDFRASSGDLPSPELFEIGQPKTDRLINGRIDKSVARERLGFDINKTTVIYAPSYESCSSMKTSWNEIAESVLSGGYNLIIKPHPGYYASTSLTSDAPHVSQHVDRINELNSRDDCVFSASNSLDATVALSASDIMITDYSGVAFDGILLDLGMIYWDCPEFFEDYMPKRYGIGGEFLREKLPANVGRSKGIVVTDGPELVSAIKAYEENPDLKASERAEIRDNLLYNPGTAGKVMAAKVREILGIQ